jgi:hypothetical protein
MLGFPSSWNEMAGGSLKKVEKSKVHVLLANDLLNKPRIVSLHIDAFASLTRSLKDSMHSAGKLLNTIFAGLINSCGIDFSIASDSSWRAWKVLSSIGFKHLHFSIVPDETPAPQSQKKELFLEYPTS